MKLNVIDVLDQCEFLNGLSEKKKHRFKEKLKGGLIKSIRLNPDQDLSSVEVDEVNVEKIKRGIQTTVSFSWLGFFFTLFWAVYHKVQLAYAVMLLLYIPSYSLLFLDYDWYVNYGDFMIRIAPIGIGMAYGMYGRGWLIGDQFSIIASERYQIKSRALPKWFYFGTGFKVGWIRVLALVGFVLVLGSIEIGLEFLLYPELW